jgi:thymidylate synthase
MNNLDIKYQELLQDILDNGSTKSDRTGTGTISVFGRQIRHKMSEGFPLLTTKKMAWKTMVTELLWFLRGDTNIKFLVDNKCHIWDGDAYKNYCTAYKDGHEFYEDEQVKRSFTQEEFINKIKTDDEFAKKWGELGPIYGAQWRNWLTYKPSNNTGSFYQSGNIDQIQNLINDLKTNPDSRRLMVSAWNVGELDQMTLPPCHYGFQVYTRELSTKERWEWYGKNGGPYGEIKLIGMMVYENEKDNSHIKSWLEKWAPNVPTRAISLMWNQRSVDTFLGLPFNIASYGLLLEIIAKEVNMVPDELIGNLGDTHLYLNHIEQAKEQIGMDLTDEERYHIWFGNNYETGMERFFDPNNLPNFDDVYYEPTPSRTREPYALPQLSFLDEYHYMSDTELVGSIEFSEKINKFRPDFFKIENYQSHPSIKAPLSN